MTSSYKHQIHCTRGGTPAMSVSNRVILKVTNCVEGIQLPDLPGQGLVNKQHRADSRLCMHADICMQASLSIGMYGIGSSTSHLDPCPWEPCVHVYRWSPPSGERYK